MPTIDLTDAEYTAITALIRRAVEEDHFPNAPRLDPLRSALARLDPASAESHVARPLTPESAKPGIRKSAATASRGRAQSSPSRLRHLAAAVQHHFKPWEASTDG